MSLPSPTFRATAAVLTVLALGACRPHGASVDRWYAAANAPSRVEPRTPEESEALNRLPTLEPTAVVVTLAAATLAFEPSYASAANRVCRAFAIQREPAEGEAIRRLACRDGDAWFLVPELLEDGSSDGPEDAL